MEVALIPWKKFPSKENYLKRNKHKTARFPILSNVAKPFISVSDRFLIFPYLFVPKNKI